MPDILHTYSMERQAIAKELIDFDREWANMLSTTQGADPVEVQKYFVRFGHYTAGTATTYKPSIISAEPAHQYLAQRLIVGKRFHSAPVIRLADAKRVELGHAIKADGRWRIIAFAGPEEPAEASSRIRVLCDYLAEAPESPIRRYTPTGADIDAVIDVRAVFQQGYRVLRLEAMPAFLFPQKGRYGLRDYEKMFCPDLKGREDIFDMRGIDRAQGCMVVVRPDQYVAHILPLDAYADLSAFFAGFMLQKN